MQVVDGVLETTVVLPWDLGSVRVARRFLADACSRLSVVDDCGTLALLGSELVTNAVLHGRSEVTVTLRATVEEHAVLLRVEVRDDNSQLPRFEQGDPLALGGRGLLLVTELADRFGVDADDLGKSVWFELASKAETAQPAAADPPRAARVR